MHKKFWCVIFAVILTVYLLLPGMSIDAKAIIPGEDTYTSEEKIYCTATVEDDFADNRILVVLTNAASLSMKTYSSIDFIEIGCMGVNNLTSTATELIEAKLTGKDISDKYCVSTNFITFDDFYDVDTESFHEVLCLQIGTPGKENVLKAIDTLMEREDVIYAGPDYALSVCASEPNDTYYGQQWAASTIQLPKAWNVTTGSSSVLVGVMDTGINSSHPELSNRVNQSMSRSFLSGSTTAVSTVTDAHGHGTHVAGIIAAQGNNGVGICGVAYNTKLVSLQVFNSSGNGYSSYVASAIDYAEAQGIPILNLSGGWSGDGIYYFYDTALYSVIANYSGLVICAAGNSGADNDSVALYPGNYSLSNLITVGASTSSDACASFSNYGKTTVDLFAPGVSILSCYPTSMCTEGTHNTENTIHYANGYHKMSGTSMATPYVTGVAALILAARPSMTAAQIKTRILSNVDEISALSNKCVSGGRLNAYLALHFTHSYTYTSYSASQHTCTCACGYSYRESHTWDTYDAVQDSIVVTFCTKCGYTKSTTTTSS